MIEFVDFFKRKTIQEPVEDSTAQVEHLVVDLMQGKLTREEKIRRTFELPHLDLRKIASKIRL
jgi:hypothetical protein